MAETRKLAAIMAIDVVGYSLLMGEDEAGTARAVREHREAGTALGVREHREAARPVVAGLGGRMVKAAALAQLGRLEEARSTFKTGHALNPTVAVSRYGDSGAAMSDDPTNLSSFEPLRHAYGRGLPEMAIDVSAMTG